MYDFQLCNLLPFQIHQNKRSQVTSGGGAIPLTAREAETIIYLVLTEYLTQSYIPSSKEGKRGLDETSVKRMEKFIHKAISSCSPRIRY